MCDETVGYISSQDIKSFYLNDSEATSYEESVMDLEQQALVDLNYSQ